MQDNYQWMDSSKEERFRKSVGAVILIIGGVMAVVILIFNQFFTENLLHYTERSPVAYTVVLMFMLLFLGPISMIVMELKKGLRSFRLAFDNRRFILIPEKRCSEAQIEIDLKDIKRMETDKSNKTFLISGNQHLRIGVLDFKGLTQLLDSLSEFRKEAFNSKEIVNESSLNMVLGASVDVYTRRGEREVKTPYKKIRLSKQKTSIFDPPLQVQYPDLYRRSTIAFWIMCISGFIALFNKYFALVFFVILPIFLILAGINNYKNEIYFLGSSILVRRGKLAKLFGIMAILTGVLILLMLSIFGIMVLLI